MKDAGPPGASSNGFNENLALFNSGKCGMWIDATVAASFVTNPKEFEGRRQGRLRARAQYGLGKNANWLWAWSLAIPAGSQKVEAAEKFIAWATSKDYPELVASKEGWANVPPGTRTSLYKNPEYLKAAPFAKLTLHSINTADPNHPTVKPVPYVGVQFAAIPEFQGIATTVGQLFSAALSGSATVDAALPRAQASDRREMKRRLYQVDAPAPNLGLPGRQRARTAASNLAVAAAATRQEAAMATQQTQVLGRALLSPAVGPCCSSG